MVGASFDRIEDIAIGADDEIAVVGWIEGDDSGAWTSRIAPGGVIVWEDQYVAVPHATALAVAVAIADDGDVVATGEAAGGLWVRRHAPDGELRWSTSYAGSPEAPLRGVAIATTSTDVLLVALTPGMDGMPSSRVLRLDEHGEEIARLDLDPAGSLFDAWDIVTDATGAAWVAGAIGEAHEPLLVRFAPGEDVGTAQTIAMDMREYVAGLVVAPNGRVVVGGAGMTSAWVEARTREGQAVWSWTEDGPRAVLDLALDGAGNIVAVGQAADADLRGWIAKLAPDGTLAWTYTAEDHEDGAHAELYHGVAIDSSAFIHVVGLFPAGHGVVTTIAP